MTTMPSKPKSDDEELHVLLERAEQMAREYLARAERAEEWRDKLRAACVYIFSNTPQSKHVVDMLRPLIQGSRQ